MESEDLYEQRRKDIAKLEARLARLEYIHSLVFPTPTSTKSVAA